MPCFQKSNLERLQEIRILLLLLLELEALRGAKSASAHFFLLLTSQHDSRLVAAIAVLGVPGKEEIIRNAAPLLLPKLPSKSLRVVLLLFNIGIFYYTC